MLTLLKKMMVLACVLALAGCGSQNFTKMGNLGDAPKKAVFTQNAQISDLDGIVACVRPYIAGKSVMLTQDKDSTGRTNSVADGAVGNFLSEGNSLLFAADMLEAAGLTLKNGLNVAGDSVTRQLVTDKKKEELKRVSDRSIPDFYLNYANLSLDWDKDMDGTVMVYGLGVYHSMQRATVAGGAYFSKADGSSDFAGQGVLSMSVFSSQGGIIVGRIIDSKLVTADVGGGVQDAMQRMTGEFLLNLSVAKAMTRMPKVPQKCRDLYDAVVPQNRVTLSS